MDSSNRHENSEYSDEASNVSTDKNNKSSIKYKNKNNLTPKPLCDHPHCATPCS
jgi:hypothetical protein